MHKQLSGKGLCGAVVFRVAGEIGDFFLCHCSRCQQSSGSAHTANLLVNGASLTWVQGADQVKSFTLPGSLYTRCFCTECGSPLPAFEAELLVVPAGTIITSKIDIAPNAHIYVGSKADWDEHLEQVTHYHELPTSDSQ